MSDEETKTKIHEEDQGDDFDLSGMPKAKEDGGEGDEGGSGDDSGDDGEPGKFGESGDNGEGDGGNSGSESGSEGDKGDEGNEGEGSDGDGKGSESGDEGSEGEGAGGEDGSGEGEGSGSEGKDGAGAEADKGGEGSSDDDFFGSEFKDDKGDSGEGSDPLNFGELAGEFELDEVETKDDFVAKVNEKIENAKQEVKVDGYTPEAQSVIKHLNDNDGKLEDFFGNKDIANMQSVLAAPAEAKVLSVKTSEHIQAGMSAEKAAEQAAEEVEDMSTREIKDAAASIDDQAKNLINEEVNKVVGDREKVVAKQRQEAENKAKTEREHLKSFVNKQADYAGIPLTDKAKENIVREIESGEFDRVANENPAASKFNAYMFAKFGKKIAEGYTKEASEQNRKGHNAATEKQMKTLHESEDGAAGSKSGKQQGEQGSKKNFEDWGDKGMLEED